MQRLILLGAPAYLLLFLSGIALAAQSLNVLAMTNNDFVTQTLPTMLDEYSEQSGIDIELILTPSIADAILRQFALEQPIDVILLPFVRYMDYRDVGWLQDLAEVLEDLRPGVVSKTNQPLRWMWGSVDGFPRCGYIPGGGSQEPSFACLWGYSPQPKQAAHLIFHLVEHAESSEYFETTALTFARKLIIEKDYASVYDHLLHPDRKTNMAREQFVLEMQRMEPCKDGKITNLHFSRIERNWNNLVDPLSGTRYLMRELTTYFAAIRCETPSYVMTSVVPFIMDPSQPIVPGFFPHEFVSTAWGEG